MDKYLHVTYELERGSEREEREILFVGDRRQHPDQMVHEGFHEHFGEATRTVEEGSEYAGPGDQTLTVKETELLSKEEGKSRQSELYSRQVNRNVTEDYAVVRYSGKRDYGD